jgi:hypothetical protein
MRAGFLFVSRLANSGRLDRTASVPGSVLLFDELIGEDPAEARAMAEWQRRRRLAARW